jgi:hypothetical protein
MPILPKESEILAQTGKFPSALTVLHVLYQMNNVWTALQDKLL